MKSIFLGSAIAVAAATGAQAADPILDVKAPRQVVYACDITGFIELPGTDICWKIGGRARYAWWTASDDFVGRAPNPFALAAGSPAERVDGWNDYGQARLNFDARTVTEYGTVRAFIEMQANNNNTNTGGAFNLRHAFVQFGNWTFGKTWSTFLHLASSPAYLDPATVVGDSYARVDQIRYTQNFGNGFTVSVALEDPGFVGTAYGSLGTSAVPGTGFVFDPLTGVAIAAPGTTVSTFGAPLDDADWMPTIVGAANYSGAWGEVQVSGALHNNEIYSVAPAGSPFAGTVYEDNDLGWAILGGLVLNAPWAGEGDAFTVKATYSDGFSAYTGASYVGGFGPDVYYGSCNVGATVAAICGTSDQWSVLASFSHAWTPTIVGVLGGGYAATNYETVYAATAFDSVDTWEVFANLSWTPVSRTTFMVDVHYAQQEFDIINPRVSDVEVDGVWGGFQVTRSF